MLNLTIGVRVPKEDRELLNAVCKARGEDLSDFIRRSIRKELASLGFLSDEQKKALGVKRAHPYVSHRKLEENNTK